jgi:hypothetical protein
LFYIFLLNLCLHLKLPDAEGGSRLWYIYLQPSAAWTGYPEFGLACSELTIITPCHYIQALSYKRLARLTLKKPIPYYIVNVQLTTVDLAYCVAQRCLFFSYATSSRPYSKSLIVGNPASEKVIDSNNKPNDWQNKAVKIYVNAETKRKEILSENAGKSGIYL